MRTRRRADVLALGSCPRRELSSRLSIGPNLDILAIMVATTTLPHGVIERIVEVLDPEEVWLFGSRARETHGPDSDWDLMAVLPDTAADRKLDIAAVWADFRELRRMRIEVIPIRRRDFEENRDTLGELAEAVAREGHVVYGR